MKILYITGDTGIEVTGRKGAATHIRETCHALLDAGHQVHLVAPVLGGGSPLEISATEVPPPTSKLLGADGRYMLLNRRMGAVIARLIRDFRPDAVYERYSLYQTAGQALSRAAGLPRILEVNTLLAKEQSNRLRFWRMAESVEKRLWRGEKAIMCVSTELKRRMSEAAGLDESRMAGFIVAPVSISADVFSPDVAPADLKPYGVEGRIVAGYTGTMTAWHGVETLIEAAGILRDTKSRIMVLAIGGEPDRVARLRARAKETGTEPWLHFGESIPHAAVPSHIAAMDMCLIPDTQDWSSPTKFFEFAAMAKPIVAANRPSVLEVMGSGEPTGLVFERGNARQLVERMEQVAADPQLARRLGEAARRRVLANYTWEHNVDRIMRLIDAQQNGRGPAAP